MSDSFASPWMVAYQAPLSMEFHSQEYWSELLFPSPGELPNTGIKPESPASPALAGKSFTTDPLLKKEGSPPKKGRLIKSVSWGSSELIPLDVKSTIFTSYGGPPHPLPQGALRFPLPGCHIRDLGLFPPAVTGVDAGVKRRVVWHLAAVWPWPPSWTLWPQFICV